VNKKFPQRTGLLDDYSTEAELAAELNKDPRTLFRWRKARIGPPFTMNGETPLYNKEQARQWLAEGGTAATKTRRRGARAAASVTA
jgi:hypothetical protein